MSGTTQSDMSMRVQNIMFGNIMFLRDLKINADLRLQKNTRVVCNKLGEDKVKGVGAKTPSTVIK